MTTLSLQLVSSPLEQFEVVPLISLHLPVVGSIVLALTNLGLYTLLTVGLLMGLHVVANNGYRLVPSEWSVSLEAIFAKLFNRIGKLGNFLGTNAIISFFSNPGGYRNDSEGLNNGPIPVAPLSRYSSLGSDRSQRTLTQKLINSFRVKYREFMTRKGT